MSETAVLASLWWPLSLGVWQKQTCSPCHWFAVLVPPAFESVTPPGCVSEASFPHPTGAVHNPQISIQSTAGREKKGGIWLKLDTWQPQPLYQTAPAIITLSCAIITLCCAIITLCCAIITLCCAIIMLCCAYYNTVLCYYNAVLCYYSTVVCYYNAVVCYYNMVVCYYNDVLCFSNQIRPISKDFSDHFSYSYSQIQCKHKQTHRKFEGFSTVGKQYTTILSQLLPLRGVKRNNAIRITELFAVE